MNIFYHYAKELYPLENRNIFLQQGRICEPTIVVGKCTIPKPHVITQIRNSITEIHTFC